MDNDDDDQFEDAKSFSSEEEPSAADSTSATQSLAKERVSQIVGTIIL